jgi:5-hydroxyisourate hydrolase
MSGITTHVLDTSLGRPASGIAVTLAVRDGSAMRQLGSASTDADGRVREFSPSAPLTAGSYQLVFETGAYFGSAGRSAFYERVTLDFVVADPAQHYHIPLLLSPFGYTTYRGS